MSDDDGHPHADKIDWDGLSHAHGMAADVPGQLALLVGADESLRREALSHLREVAHHQNTIYEVTGPVVHGLTGLVQSPRLRGTPGSPDILLADVMEFFWSVAHDCLDALRSETDEVTREILSVREAFTTVPAAVRGFLDDPEPAVRVSTIAALAAATSLDTNQATLARLLDEYEHRMSAVTDRDERAALVAAIGRHGGDTRTWSSDSDLLVRVCATLAYDTATPVEDLAALLSRPHEMTRWFRHRPLDTNLSDIKLAEAYLQHDVPLDEMLPVAIAVLRAAEPSPWPLNDGWGRIMLRAFPEAPDVQRPTLAQRFVLRELVANERLWDPGFRAAQTILAHVGLPAAHEDVAVLALPA